MPNDYNSDTSYVSDDFIDSLNKQQQEAVLHSEGPILVLAGAGTGKTRVLTSRIAHLISSGQARPEHILAVTFTNKAAKEMSELIARIAPSHGLWIGTFHSICVRILRKHSSNLGINENFIIIDADDQLRVIKNIFKDFNIDEKSLEPKFIAATINRWMTIRTDFTIATFVGLVSFFGNFIFIK